MLTVQAIYDFIHERASFDTQDAYDNAGLLVGHPDQEVTGIHVAMDVTPTVLDEAIACGANLIITHHPLMFAPRKRLVETDYEAQLLCRMIRHRISLIAAHTNLDQAAGGINDVLAQVCGLTNITGEGFIRVGDLPHPMTVDELTAHVSRCLNTVVRPMGHGQRITRLGVCSGSGGDEWAAALSLGAQAFLSGEIKHHLALEAVGHGLTCLEAGHHATEEPGIFALADALQIHLNALQYPICVSKSQAPAYA